MFGHVEQSHRTHARAQETSPLRTAELVQRRRETMATPMEAFAAMQRKLREDSKTYESLSEGACDSAMTTTTTTTKEEEGNV
jgi:hypothetical protein